MDRLSTIELALNELLSRPDKTLQPNGYTFLTETGQVAIDDEVVTNAINSSLSEYDVVDYTIEQSDDGEENEEWGEGANCLRNVTDYVVTARVKTDPGSKAPKRDAKIKCNEVLQDIKYLLASDSTLGGEVYWVKFNNATRRYNTSQNITRSADLIIEIELTYGQAYTRPDLNASN